VPSTFAPKKTPGPEEHDTLETENLTDAAIKRGRVSTLTVKVVNAC
jgi:hypothetical protein